MAKALLLKEEGNRHFTSGDFLGAESLYSKAIIADSTNPALYTNRAMARLKLKLWESVIGDCTTCLSLSHDNMKAHYYLAQAQVEVGQHEEAVVNAVRAHKLCVDDLATNDKSLSSVTALVLRCKKERWESRERRRVREDRALEAEVVRMLERERDERARDLVSDGTVGEDENDKEGLVVGGGGGDDGDGGGSGGRQAALLEEARVEVMEMYEEKLERLRGVFERSRNKEEREQVVPDWAIDDIGFGFMVDPVITKTGKSYERATIMEHLRRSETDPLTREPLHPRDLRPNLALKQACEEFLEENGWAVDW